MVSLYVLFYPFFYPTTFHTVHKNICFYGSLNAKWTHNSIQVNKNTYLMSSYFIFFLEIDSTTITVDHEDPRRPVVAL